MGLLSSIAKTAGNLLYNATGAQASAKQQYEYQSKLQQQQNDYNVYNMQHSYQWTMNDMAKAGLNPVLAASNGANSVGAVGAGSTSGGQSQGDILGTITSALDLAMKKDQTESNVNLQDSQAKLNSAKAMESLENTKNLTPKASAEIRHLNSATAVNEAEKTLKKAQLSNMSMDTELKSQQRWNLLHQNQKIDSEKDLTKKKVRYYELENSAKALGSLLK